MITFRYTTAPTSSKTSSLGFAVQLTGTNAAECRPTFKLGDARHLICSLVEWLLSHCPPLQNFLDQYITNLKHLLSAGVVQADFHSALRRPVQARVRQARVGCCSAAAGCSTSACSHQVQLSLRWVPRLGWCSPTILPTSSNCLAATCSTYPEIGTTIHFRYTAKEAAFSGYWVYFVKMLGRNWQHLSGDWANYPLQVHGRKGQLSPLMVSCQPTVLTS